MASVREQIQELQDTMRNAPTVSSLREMLDEVSRIERQEETAVQPALDIRDDAFRLLQRLTRQDPDVAETFILDYLLRECTRGTGSVPADAAYLLSQLRTRLVDWMGQYPRAERERIRSRVLDKLHVALQAKQPDGASWTVAQIGFRRADIVDALWRVVTVHEGLEGDPALAAIAALGLVPHDRSDLVHELNRRIPSRWSVGLWQALRLAADRRTLPAVRQHWLSPRRPDDSREHASLALRVPVSVADEYYGDRRLQDRTWEWILELFQSDPKTFGFDIYLGSEVSPRINSPSVIGTLLGLMAEAPDQTSAERERVRYLLYLRLEECTRPRQIEGWHRVPPRSTHEILQQDATQDSGYEGLDQTSEGIAKLAAWDTLLRLGSTHLLGLYEAVVENETSTYLRRDIADRLACFRLDPLPDAVKRDVMRPYDWDPEGSSTEGLRLDAAIDLARSNPSWTVFEALLNFGLTLKGHVLQSVVDALSDVAVVMANEDRERVVSDLLAATSSDHLHQHRVAAVGALRELAGKRLLRKDTTWLLLELLLEKDGDDFMRSQVVATLAAVRGFVPTNDYVNELSRWADERGTSDDLGWQSFIALAIYGKLGDHPKLLHSHLHLYEEHSKWHLTRDADIDDHVAAVIGLLYRSKPTMFESAFVSVIQGASWRNAYQVLRTLHLLGRDLGHLPEAVRDAAVRRIQSGPTVPWAESTWAESQMIRVLGKYDPAVLLTIAWQEEGRGYSQDVCTSLAESLGAAAFHREEQQERAGELLLHLTRDPRFAVRRSAYRGLKSGWPNAFVEICRRWSRDPRAELRLRAAEATSWIPRGRGHSRIADELLNELLIDPELEVRNAAQRARDERRIRVWARVYLNTVRSARPFSNSDILLAWAAGQALARIGDDDSLDALRLLRGRPGVPLHARHWLGKLIDDLEKRWTEVVKEWPQNTDPWEGDLPQMTFAPSMT